MEPATRLAAERDYEAALAVWREANCARDQAPSAAREQRVRAKLADHEAAVLVAAEEQQVVGMLLAEDGRADDSTPIAELGHISMLFVCPNAWRRGVGSALLKALEPIARERKWRRLSLWTRESNLPAQKLYERAGFERAGEMKPLSANDLIGRWERRL